MPTESPTLTIPTPYGIVHATVLDPSQDSKRHVLRLNLDGLTVNRIPIRGSVYLRYRNRHWDNGATLAKPVRELTDDLASSYIRRNDKFDSPTHAVYNKLRKMYNTVIRTAFEAAPEKLDVARRFSLEQALDTARGRVEQAKRALAQAVDEENKAMAELEAFNREGWAEYHEMEDGRHTLGEVAS